jgi:hypothetical protein
MSSLLNSGESVPIKIRAEVTMRQLISCWVVLFIILNASNVFGQSVDSVDVEKTSLQFAKMLIIAKAMLTEAQTTKDDLFISIAARYLSYARNNLEKLRGSIDSKRFEDSQGMIIFLERACESGVNPEIGIVAGAAVIGVKIDMFIKSIYIKE